MLEDVCGGMYSGCGCTVGVAYAQLVLLVHSGCGLCTVGLVSAQRVWLMHSLSC